MQSQLDRHLEAFASDEVVTESLDTFIEDTTTTNNDDSDDDEEHEGRFNGFSSLQRRTRPQQKDGDDVGWTFDNNDNNDTKNDPTADDKNGNSIEKGRNESNFTKISMLTMKEMILLLLWVVPVSISIGNYIGIIFSVPLCFGTFLFLLHFSTKSDKQHIPPDTTESTVTKPTKGGNHRNDPKRDEDQNDGGILLEQKMKLLRNCRRQISRLLGLIGAPPLPLHRRRRRQQQTQRDNLVDDYDDNDDDNDEDGDNDFDRNNMMMPAQLHRLHNTDIDDDIDIDIDVNVETMERITNLIITFIAAHCQLLLTYDKVYYYIQVTSSIHYGLGPSSQCIERIERSMIGREFRNQQKKEQRMKNKIKTIQQNDSDNNNNNNIGDGNGNHDNTNTDDDDEKEQQQQEQQEQEQQQRHNQRQKREIQRGGIARSVLSLIHVRKNLAAVIVEQSMSLQQVWKDIIVSINRTSTKSLSNYRSMTFNPAGEDNGLLSSLIIDDDDILEPIYVPTVIDLTWLKSTRNQLARIVTELSYFIVRHFLSTTELNHDHGHGLVTSLFFRSKEAEEDDDDEDNAILYTTMTDSIADVNDLKEYVISHLLLDGDDNNEDMDDDDDVSMMEKHTGAGTMATELSNVSQRGLLLSLLQYRNQLDALGNSLWTCQHSIIPNQDLYGHDDDDDDEDVGYEKDDDGDTDKYNIKDNNNDTNNLSILKCWNRVQQISIVCHEIEASIQQRYFLKYNDDDDDDDDNDEVEKDPMLTKAQHGEQQNSGNYEHVGPSATSARTSSHENDDANNGKRKTMIFKGHGSIPKKEKRRGRKNNNNKNNNNNTSPNEDDDNDDVNIPSALIPPRDVISEQLLIQELQMRVKTLVSSDDEDEDDDDDDDDNDDDNKDNEKEDDGNIDRDDDVREKELGNNNNNKNFSHNHQHMEKKNNIMNVSTPQFLGATGPLLNELKLHLIPPSSMNRNDDDDDDDLVVISSSFQEEEEVLEG